ncbi:MAG: hypothetical protein WDK95_06095 [Syntrophorhabdaceae bacterium]
MNLENNLNKILKLGQMDSNLSKKFFYTKDNELYFTTDNNLSSPKFRVYEVNLDRNHSFVITRVKKFKMDINLKNRLIKCTEIEFEEFINNFKMILELQK